MYNKKNKTENRLIACCLLILTNLHIISHDLILCNKKNKLYDAYLFKQIFMYNRVIYNGYKYYSSFYNYKKLRFLPVLFFI